MTLVGLLPNRIALLIGIEGEEIRFGRYKDKEFLIKKLAKYQIELCEDVYIDWGLIYHDDKMLLEVFVDSSKYVKLWGKEKFLDVFSRFGLKEIKNMRFIDEFPKVRYPLKRLKRGVKESAEIIGELLDD